MRSADDIHRTWVDFLLAANMRDIAAIIADAQLWMLNDEWGSSTGLLIDLPPSSAMLTDNSPNYRQTMVSTLCLVMRGHLQDRNGDPVWDREPTIEFRMRLTDTEENWRQVVKELVANAKNPNRAVVTGKVFAREGKQLLTYNEMKFGSQGEIRIAQELERRKVLFFPLPLAVRADTGNYFQDHKEPDFLICYDGVWGILEIAYHPDRYEQDKEKDLWFKQSGILCVEHYTWERCMNEPAAVVSEVLGILARHKRT